MRIVAVPDSHELGQNGLWDRVRDKVVELLDQRNIKVSSVDFVRFTWLNKKEYQEVWDEDEDEDGEDEDEDDEDEEEEEDDDDDDDEEEEELSFDDILHSQPVEDGERYYTNATVWIGALLNTLPAAVAREASEDIRAFLDSLQVQNVDIAFRESAYNPLLGHGPALYRPAEYGDPLKDIIDNVSVPLSLPISDGQTYTQGTLGPYFRVGEKLYAVTTRHNLFSLDGDNDMYTYHESAPKKEVIVMGVPAFETYLASIKELIQTLTYTVESLENQTRRLKDRVQDGINVHESRVELGVNEAVLAPMQHKLDNVKTFFTDIKNGWSQPKDRVVGFVRWAPPIGVGVAPHGYTRDLCVVELHKERFKHMLGNVLSLGPELSSGKLKSMMYERTSKFEYPDDGLLALRGILTAKDISNPNTQGDNIRRVLKRGSATNTTVGTLSRFKSFTRQYFPTDTLDSLQVPILSHEHDLGTFSDGGDSGSLIVSPTGEFVALLTGGAGMGKGGSDITYATPFEFVWDLVKEEFPGADLCFDKLEEFLADVA